ncbi:MAG: methionyl-tRNA formyltransferase [Candidatus Daviesbacteria bacterium]|nr:methionyl-tRNA formyltransferase [Candidatus Daviesbacteria bacterium]
MSKILFVGGREKGYVILSDLLKLDAEIVKAFILEEDSHETERFSSKISQLCEAKKIPFKVCKNINNQYDELSKLAIDLLVVSGWRSIIPKRIIDLAKKGGVAFHESLLPKYRGFAPINWAVINGEKRTGVTLFYLDQGIDNGRIIAQETIEIRPNQTTFDIYKKTIKTSSNLLKRNFSKLITGKVKTKKQNELEATYTCARTPEDGKIIWLNTTERIHNLIRALSNPYPGAFCFIKNKKIIIQKSKTPPQKNWIGKIPGRVVSINKDIGVEVLTGNGSILIKLIEVDGKVLNAADYIKSIKSTLI